MKRSEVMKRWWLALPVAVLCVGAIDVLSAGVGSFLGKVAVEWDDSDAFNRYKVKLLNDFGFQDPAGKQWVARQGALLDGSSFTPLFEEMVGLPFAGEHRRAGILHDFYAQQLSETWKDTRRMYYAAVLAEGLNENEAKTAYAILYGAGLRWEKKGSTCYINCHSAVSSLAWKPDVTKNELETGLDVLEEGNPSLDDIDRAMDAVIPRPGPHLFSQLRPEKSPAAGGVTDEPAAEDEKSDDQSEQDEPARK